MRPGRAVGCLLALLMLTTSASLGAEPEAICHDDFNDPRSGWNLGSGNVGTAQYRNGHFEIRVARSDELFWSWAPCKSVPDGFVMEATGRSRLGADEAAWGVVWGVDDENLLAFLITPTGMMAVLSMRDGKWTIPVFDWIENAAIHVGDGEPNTLWVTVDGDSVTIRINNLVVGRFEIGSQPDLGAGLLKGAKSTGPGPVSLEDGSAWRVGLVAGAFDITPVELGFDEFAVYELP
jgi:hypothetical protein